MIRHRRSAQAFDGLTTITAPSSCRMLDALLPRTAQPPWALAEDAPWAHPMLFVHHVEGTEPGIYCLPGSPAALVELRADLLWASVPGCPAHLPFYLLAPMDARDFAAAVSRHQNIAADSAFALAMLARLDDIDPAHGWRYREASMLWQVLHLEAEAAGVHCTGIGCHVDDAVHRALGLNAARLQDLSHFTVGKAVVDTRLGSDAPCANCADRRG